MKIVIAGNYGAKNIGDEMILEGILLSFKNIAPQAKFTVLSANPEETSQKCGIESAFKFPAGIRSILKYIFSYKNETKKAVKGCDYFVLGGGGLFSNLTLKAYFIWGIQGLMACYYKKPLIMYGQSVGPVKGKIQKYIVTKLFKKAVFITLRDKESREELKSLGIKSKINVIPDMAFKLETPKKEQDIKKKMVIALRASTNFDPDLKQKIIEFLNWAVNKQDYELEFANFQLPEDAQLNEEISANINNQKKIKTMPTPKNAQELLNHFAEADFVLGMRLHSIISSIKAERPFIAINYAPKVENFLNYAKLKNTIFQATESSLKEKFISINAEKNQLITKLEDFNLHAEKRHKEIERDLKSFLS